MPSRLSQSQLRQALRQPSEKALQRDVVQLLRQLGYVVCETGKAPKPFKCRHCGTMQFPDTGTDSTVGTPDTFTAHPDSGNWFRAMELKAPGAQSLLGTLQPGRIRPEQKKLVELGVSQVITTVEGAIELVRELRK